MHYKKYLEQLDCEIDKLIKRECDGLHYDAEKALHVLLENRKHTKRLMEEYHGQAPAGAMTETSKSYFGG